MLVNGPAAAMKNSARADGGSRVRLATPPSRNSVIDETDIRNRRATSECASSCASTDAKKSSAVTAETASAFSRDQRGNWPG